MSKLVFYREQLNLTQEELSKKSGISVRTIQRIEAGTDPKGHTRKVLAEALEIKENNLLEMVDENEDINYNLLKLINLSSLLFIFIPPVNIIIPLIRIFAKKQLNPLSIQIISIQILWAVLMGTVFIIGSIFSNWFSIKRDFILILLIVLALVKVFIILRNNFEVDKNKKLYIQLNFSII